MKDLYEAIGIFLKYASDTKWPTHCEHDFLYIFADITLDKVSKEDTKRLDELGFSWDEESESFTSYRFGSC